MAAPSSRTFSTCKHAELSYEEPHPEDNPPSNHSTSMKLTHSFTAAALLILPALLRAQTSVGTVAISGADVVNATNGLVAVTAGRATLTGAATVTAHPGQSAQIDLTRGGAILVCQTTALHIAQLHNDPAPPSLFLAVDRGALELRTPATPADTLTTPDFRLTPLTAGPLDLQIRVSRNGDTCLDNRGKKAPALNLTDAFGQATYQLKPGQHVLFVGGSLRTVVDRETTPCGCPPADPVAVPLAEAVLRGGSNATPPSTPAQAAATNPFPTAVSEGLADPTPVPTETPGETHVQVASTLTFNPDQPHSATTVPPAQPPPAAPPAAQPGSNPFRALGHFLKSIFVR